MMDPTPQFLDVPSLLERSRPRPRVNWFWYAVGAFLLLVMGGTYLSAQSTAGRIAVEVVSVFLTIGLIAAMSVGTMFAVRRLRDAQMQIDAAQELVQLRRWPEAGVLLTQILSQPVRTHAMRFEALLYLTTLLARYHRFDEAITVQNHLLEIAKLDPNTDRAIKTGRAMAMLREDHLFDADRAIAELRRGDARDTSGGLALIEMYRDVKTGHPAEAIDIFNQRLPILREQLGHRVGDAHGLVAKAHDLLGQRDAAQRAYHRATLLAPPQELARRYPELASLAATYQAAVVPKEAE